MHRNSKLVIETILIFFLNGSLAYFIWNLELSTSIQWICYIPVLLFQGLWLYRIYIVGHEASHKKLFPNNRQLNDLVGTVILLPLLVPINIYRKIHLFHHGFNRKDPHTSALDTYTIKGNFKSAKKLLSYISWYLSVFFGGFFLHSLISVVLFLFVPPKLAVKISPAFKAWTLKDQLQAILSFLLGVSIHFSVIYFFGTKNYLLFLGFPMLAFAWILSFLVYIFHYKTTIGSQVRYNARSVNRVPIVSWILMNFNEHATHHQFPNIPWYELPQKRKELPKEFAEKNQNTHNFFRAILNQLKGPNIVYED